MTQTALNQKVKQLEGRLIRIEGLIWDTPTRPAVPPIPTKSVWERTTGLLGQSKVNDLLRSVRSVRRNAKRRTTPMT